MKRNDLLLALTVILVAAVIFAFQFFSGNAGNGKVKITVNGENYGIYDLSTDQTVNVNETNYLIIKNGKVRMEQADCPDQICVHHKAISRNGESIICLPNRVVVSVENSEVSSLDGIAQ